MLALGIAEDLLGRALLRDDTAVHKENAVCHLALGMGFSNCIKDYENYTLKECQDMGINDSVLHEDFMIGSEDLDIMGITKDGKEYPIFRNGNWAF